MRLHKYISHVIALNVCSFCECLHLSAVRNTTARSRVLWSLFPPAVTSLPAGAGPLLQRGPVLPAAAADSSRRHPGGPLPDQCERAGAAAPARHRDSDPVRPGQQGPPHRRRVRGHGPQQGGLAVVCRALQGHGVAGPEALPQVRCAPCIKETGHLGAGGGDQCTSFWWSSSANLMNLLSLVCGSVLLCRV
jgi:hypothetical protein